jgi:hypothetical protein
MLARLSHLLIPQESNNFKARVLHHSSLSSIIGFILITQLFLSSVLIVKPSVLGFASQISPDRIVELTNVERAKVGAGPVKLNSLLSEAAQRKAGDMFAFDYWSHNSPSGRDPWSFFKEVGYRYLYAGENLARDFSSPEAVVSAWMASPSHRENLLNPKYQEIGVSVVDGTLGGTETTLVVQHFGTQTQAVAQVPPKAVNQETVTKITPTPGKTIANITPVLTPTPTPQTFVETEVLDRQVVLAQARGTEKSLLNPFNLTKDLSFGILLALAIFIILDGFIAYKKGVFRLAGRSTAHFLFLGMAILIVILSSQGAIL